MEITGKVEQLLELVSGTSPKGEWKKQDVIISTIEQFPKKVCVTLWGNLTDLAANLIGEIYSFEIQVQSREYNSKWYTDVRAIKLNKYNGEIKHDISPEGFLYSKIPPANLDIGDDEGELPF